MARETIVGSGIWDAESADRLQHFEERRSLTIRATRQLLANFCRENIPKNAKVLEIGSGTGFLKRNLPTSINVQWIQLDGQRHFLQIAKTNLPQEVYVCASAYNLPFRDNTFDVVCGFSSFDTFPNVDKAVSESHRVLKKGGLFFHMLDLLPSSKILDIYLKDQGLIPPNNQEDKHLYFTQRLIRELKNEFKKEPNVTILSAKYIGRKTTAQEHELQNVFNSNSNSYGAVKTARLVFLAGSRKMMFRFSQRFSKKLADRIGPTVIETSSIRCVKVKK